MSKYAFFDVDSTIYDGYCTSDFYLFLAKNKYIDNPEFVFQRDKEIGEDYYNKRIDYAEASRQVVQLTADILKGRRVDEVVAWGKHFVSEHDKLFEWVPELFNYLETNGYTIYLISAAANPPIQAIADFLKSDRVYASGLEVKEGAYTGRVELMLNYDEKVKLIHSLTKHLTDAYKIGFGDSMGDVDMLSQMAVSFLYKPKVEELISLASEKGWFLVNETTIIDTVKSNIR